VELFGFRTDCFVHLQVELELVVHGDLVEGVDADDRDVDLQDAHVAGVLADRRMSFDELESKFLHFISYF
jgi:hypothetical protein